MKKISVEIVFLAVKAVEVYPVANSRESVPTNTRAFYAGTTVFRKSTESKRVEYSVAAITIWNVLDGIISAVGSLIK